MGRYDDAERAVTRSLSLREHFPGNHELEIAHSLKNLGGIRLAQGRYAEAGTLLKRALAIREKLLGPDHPDVSDCLVTLADIDNESERYAEAEPLAKRAMESRRKHDGDDDTDAMVTLSASYLGQGKLADAERLLKEALAIDERAYGSEGREVADSLIGLARIDREHGRYDNGLAKLKRVLVIREHRGKDHPDVARCLRELGELEQARGNNVEAESVYRRALAIWPRAGLPDHLQFARLLESYAKWLRRVERSREAHEMDARARAIRAKQSAKSSTE